MTDEQQKNVFAKNLRFYLSLNDKSQTDVAKAINVSPQTFNTWCQGIAIPRMSKIEKLANYFQINKTDLIEERTHEINTKYDFKVAQLMNKLKNDSILRNFVIDFLDLSDQEQLTIMTLVSSLNK